MTNTELNRVFHKRHSLETFKKIIYKPTIKLTLFMVRLFFKQKLQTHYQ